MVRIRASFQIVVFASIITAGLLALVGAEPIYAQDPSNSHLSQSTEDVAQWHTHFDEQAARMLGDEISPSSRTTVMHNIILVAMNEPDGVDLSATVRPLLSIVREDTSPQQQLMALQTLHTIGEDHVNEQLYRFALRRLSRMRSKIHVPQVRRRATAMLASYYDRGEEA